MLIIEGERHKSDPFVNCRFSQPYLCRLRVPLRGTCWKIYGPKARNSVFNDQVVLDCLGHEFYCVDRAEINGVVANCAKGAASNSHCSRFFLLTNKETTEQSIVEIISMSFCKNCSRLVLEVNDYVVDCFTESSILISHIFLLLKSENSFRTYSIYSDCFNLIPCVHIESLTFLYFCAALQWQSSD